MHLYSGFFQQQKSTGKAVEGLIELTQHKERYALATLQMNFIAENCERIMILITYLEATRSPLAVYTYNRLEDIRAFLTAGTKKESFGPKTDEELPKLPVQDRKKIVKTFNTIFEKALANMRLTSMFILAWNFVKLLESSSPLHSYRH
ncbi:hypothetical protein SNE40_021443 [Patella caerulea]|uniref:Uncharacterized protein n=1 Tax=Patella caerulea TaxID=87958 RepID=A0AAN8G3Z5_PATCE